jgi:integrase
MPKPRPPHLVRQVNRHGKPVWYFRIYPGPRIRIKAAFGTPEFDAEYQAALSGNTTPTIATPTTRTGSLAWLIERYRDSSDWTGLSLATRRQRENIFKGVIASAGSSTIASVTSAVITAGRDRRKATPFQARHFLDAMRGLFAWAKSAGFVKVDPAESVKYLTLKSGEGFPVWTEEEVDLYEKRWPLGTRQRVWLAVLMYTGLRRGDAVRLGKQHVRNGVATIRTQKTGTDVHIPLLPPLVEVLKAGPTAELAFICGINGKPMTKESFGNAFSDACRQAGLKKSAHGLRKIGATRAANNGATVAQLNALFGWTGSKMASLYTQSADRKRLAQDAIGMLANEERSYSPSPDDKVRGPKQKRK